MRSLNHKLVQQVAVHAAAILAMTVCLPAWAQRATPVPQSPIQVQQAVKAPLARTQDLNLLIDQLSRGEEQSAMTTWRRFVAANASQLRNQAEVDRIVSRVVTEASRKAQAAQAPQGRTPHIEAGRPPVNDSADMQSLQLQNSLDRQSKALQMLSNVSKKMSDTASSIIQNLK